MRRLFRWSGCVSPWRGALRMRRTLDCRPRLGWPLYLSLGYVVEPVQHRLARSYRRAARPADQTRNHRRPRDPLFQATLLREFEQIVISRPWLFIENVRAKAARVHQLANEPSGASTGTLMTQPPALVLFYRAVPWVLAVSLILLAWRGTAEARGGVVRAGGIGRCGVRGSSGGVSRIPWRSAGSDRVLDARRSGGHDRIARRGGKTT